MGKKTLNLKLKLEKSLQLVLEVISVKFYHNFNGIKFCLPLIFHCLTFTIQTSFSICFIFNINKLGGDDVQGQGKWQQLKKYKNFSVHQIANKKTIMLSTENVQKVFFKPKLQRFEGKIAVKSAIKLLREPFVNSPHRAKLGPNPKIYAPIR